jgi:hypothetical protein
MPEDPCRHRKRLVGGVAVAAKSTTLRGDVMTFSTIAVLALESTALETALSLKGFDQTFSATLKF